MSSKTSHPGLFVGPMSKTVVDACIEFSNASGTPIGLIPSRRQVDWDRGYVNGWTTKTLAEYVRPRGRHVVLERDHGGAAQGDTSDDGMESFAHDAAAFDIIHVDPFKACKTLDSAAEYTADVINRFADRSQCDFEIGTEEALFPMAIADARKFFEAVRLKTGRNFERVRYLVVQFGTKLLGARNTGCFDRDRAAGMVAVCREFGKLSKEHNGDYLSAEGVRERRQLGLDAINIAPEMGGIESECILDAIEAAGDDRQRDEFLECCLETGRWKKWFPPDFDPRHNPTEVLRACGHYCFSTPRFGTFMQHMDGDRIVVKAKEAIKARLQELL